MTAGDQPLRLLVFIKESAVSCLRVQRRCRLSAMFQLQHACGGERSWAELSACLQSSTPWGRGVVSTWTSSIFFAAPTWCDLELAFVMSKNQVCKVGKWFFFSRRR